MAYRFAAYSLPHLAVDPHVALVDQLPVQDWSFEDQRLASRSTLDLAIPSSQVETLNSLFFVNPDDHAQDIGSIIHVYRDGIVDAAGNPAPALSFLLGRRPDGMEDVSTELTELQGHHIITLFDYAYLRAWDYPTFPSNEIDWMYGADSVLDNGGFEDGTIGNEIQSIWIDEDVTAGTWSANFRGDLAGGIAFDVNNTDLETALNAAFTTMLDISVSGQGTEDDPWLIEFADPGGNDEPQMIVSGAGLTGGSVHVDTVQNGGEPSLNKWTKSTLLNTGQLHGRYSSDGFAISDIVAHSGTYSLRINGLTQFAGAQQIVEVVPGMRYRASIWMYTESATDKFRLVIRDRFEALVAHSTPFEDTGTPFAWKEFTCEFVAPMWTNMLVFRFAYVGTGNPIPFWIDDASLAPGAAAATIGTIFLEMLADIQTDHALDARGVLLTYAIPTFDAVNDSGGTAWPGVHQITLNEGHSYLQIIEHWEENYGYEFDFRYDQDDDEFYFDIYVPGGMGIAHPPENPAIVVGGGVTGGEAVRSAPLANSVFVRGSAGVWYEAQYGSSDAWGVRETHVSAKDAHSWEDLRQIGQHELDKHELAMVGMQFKIADNAQSIPMLHFRAADYLTVTPGSDTAIPSGARRVETIKVSGHGGQVTDIDVHVQNEVYGSLGLAAQAEAVRRLLRAMRFTEPVTGGAGNFSLGGGGMAYKLIVASTEPESVVAKADVVVSTESLTELQAAIDSVPFYAVCWLAGFWFFTEAGTLDIPSGMHIRGFRNTILAGDNGAVTVQLNNGSSLDDIEFRGETSVLMLSESSVDNIGCLGFGTGAFIHMADSQTRVGSVMSFGADYPDGTIYVDSSADVYIERLMATGDTLALKANAAAQVHVGSLGGIGCSQLINLFQCEGVVIDTIMDVGSGGDPDQAIYVDTCVGVEFPSGILNAPTATTTAGIYVTNSEDVTFGPTFVVTEAFNNVLEFEDAVDCRFMGILRNFGMAAVAVAGITLSGTTHGTFITGATFRPTAVGPNTATLAINDLTTGMINYAVGNDFGDVSLYLSSPAVAGNILLDWPADATYGDNFST